MSCYVTNRGVGVIVMYCLFAVQLRSAEPNFKFHFIRENPAWLTSAHQTILVDIDNDGDLDWTVGNVHKEPSLYWFEYRGPEDWVEHFIGSEDIFYGGACAIDVNKDGWMDIVSSQILFVNQGHGKQWSKYNINTAGEHCHDLEAVDLNQDGKVDLISNGDASGLFWYEAGSDPTKAWTRHDIGGSAYRIHASAFPKSVADLDGDGDLDVAAAQAWFENLDGKGQQWQMHIHALIGLEGPWGTAVRTEVLDFDFDGDMDIVQAECDHRETAGIGWLENTDGKGNFAVHWIKPRVPEDYHTLAVLDYDADGDWDVFSAVGPLGKSEKRTYLFENLSGQGNKPVTWQEHTILSGPLCHEGIAGDVDQDGDVDLIIKGWTSGSFIYAQNLLR